MTAFAILFIALPLTLLLITIAAGTGYVFYKIYEPRDTVEIDSEEERRLKVFTAIMRREDERAYKWRNYGR